MLLTFRRTGASPLPDLSPRLSILLVCTANLCRSPMAEGALRRMLDRSGIRADIDSAGTHDYGADLPPCSMSIQTARRHGYDISAQVGRQVRPHDFRYFDLILAMDKRNRRHLRRVAGAQARDKVLLLLDFSRSFAGEEVSDPYGRGQIAFEEAHRRITSGCAGIARHVATRLSERPQAFAASRAA
jgi:protein-tyrosine phosphatase